MTRNSIAAADEARERLLGMLKPGDTVYTVIRSVSASGMSRRIDFYAIEDNRPQWLTALVAKAIGLRYAYDDRGVLVKGCGMDMGFECVYNLGAVLWPHGTVAPHRLRNGVPDRDGGYALKQEWI